VSQRIPDLVLHRLGALLGVKVGKGRVYVDYRLVPFRVIRRIYDIGERGMTSIRMFLLRFPIRERGLRSVLGGRGMV